VRALWVKGNQGTAWGVNKLPDPGQGYFLITEMDFARYQPKRPTDEYWDEGYQKWISVRFTKDNPPLFWKDTIYRRSL
jgi:hypothetical protein